MVIDGKNGYARISLLSACNLHCFYCRPTGSGNKSVMVAPFNKVLDTIKLFHKCGIRKVRFTGGEPTLYNRFAELIARTREIDCRIMTAVTTNGLRLSSLAKGLAEAGLDSANISLDTLDRDKFRTITGRDGLEMVKAGLAAAVKYIPEVKLNCVLMRGVNDNEVEEMIVFAGAHGVDVRFIEYMPSRHSSRGSDLFISGEAIRSRLPYRFNRIADDNSAAAVYYSTPDLSIRVGFINPVSHPFCSACNRFRLRADGRLYGCLFSQKGVDLFDLPEINLQAFKKALDTVVKYKRIDTGTNSIRDHTDLPSFISLGG